MLLKDYRLEIFNNECMPGAITVQCIAHLVQDVSAALPYLNTALGGFEYVEHPPAVTFKVHGKLITVHGRRIAANALKDEEEARKIIEWLKREINNAWENREHIKPTFEGASRPQVIEILKRLPRTNCRECGESTCMVFATRIAEGAKGINACPALSSLLQKQLEEYLSHFNLND
jgi:ArsR family metal-binding transcriptional regulator